MKFAKLSGPQGLALLSIITSSIAMAADPGWYVGGNVGQSYTQIDDYRIANNALRPGVHTTSINADDKDTAYKFFGGYQVNNYFALEAGYFDLGKFSSSANTAPPGTLNGNVKVTGLNLDAIGILPMGEKFSAFGRAGMDYVNVNSPFSGTGAAAGNSRHKENDINYKAGLGVQYAFTRSLSMRLEGERYHISDTSGSHGNIDLASVGLVYRFGGPTPAPVQRAAAPVYVEPQYIPAPPPKVAVAAPIPKPVAATPRKVVFTSDSFFDFDKTALTPSSKQKLDTFTKDLAGTEYSIITVTGHTDRIGTHEYNQDLSVRRADAVKTYLVETSKLPTEKIVTVGVEETDPVTMPTECDDETTRKGLIICLQPDRRVEVEVDKAKAAP